MLDERDFDRCFSNVNAFAKAYAAKIEPIKRHAEMARAVAHPAGLDSFINHAKIAKAFGWSSELVKNLELSNELGRIVNPRVEIPKIVGIPSLFGGFVELHSEYQRALEVVNIQKNLFPAKMSWGLKYHDIQPSGVINRYNKENDDREGILSMRKDQFDFFEKVFFTINYDTYGFFMG